MIERLVVGELQTNCYLVYRKLEAVVIDPGGEPEKIKRALRSLGLQPVIVLLTHGHFDHYGAAADLGVEILLHEADAELAADPARFFPFAKAFGAKPLTGFTTYAEDRLRLTFAGVELELFHTPGHSPGSVCIYWPEEEALFTGDTLFKNSVGRTDFAGGSLDELKKSLERISSFPGETKLFPGHGPASNLEYELAENPFIRNF